VFSRLGPSVTEVCEVIVYEHLPTQTCASVYEHVPTQACESTPACPPELVDIFLDKLLAAPELDAGGGLHTRSAHERAISHAHVRLPLHALAVRSSAAIANVAGSGKLQNLLRPDARKRDDDRKSCFSGGRGVPKYWANSCLSPCKRRRQ
jgi:hypothetical protein